MNRKIGLMIGLAALTVSLATSCAGIARGSPQTADAVAPVPTQTPWIVVQTVVVTRIVEVVATPTDVPPTPVPTATPVADLAGTRDLAMVPRPPSSAITRFATTRRHLFLDYSYSADGPSASDIAEFFTTEMGGLGWELTRLESDNDRYSLTFEPAADAAVPLNSVNYVRILVRGDVAEVAVVLNTRTELSDWEAFFES